MSNAESQPAAIVRVPLPLTLRLFWAGSVLAFGLMFVLGYLRYLHGYPEAHYNPLGGPWFDDLLEYVPTYRLLHTAAFFRNPSTSSVAYPPFGAVLFAALYASGRPAVLYLVVAALFLGASVFLVRRALIAEHIAPMTATLFPLTLVLVSFPTAGLLQRSNIELFLWIFAAVGAWAFLRGHDNAAALLWAFAAATKLYPLIFFALLFPRRRWRALALGIASFVLVSVASLAWLGPTIPIAWQGSLANVFGYQSLRVGQWTIHELAANHSAFNLAKLFAIVVHLPLTGLTLPYYALGALVFAAVFFGRVARLPAANQVLCVTTVMVMLPPVSYMYTLVHLYTPLLMLIFVELRAARAATPIPGLRLTLLLFVPLLGSFMLLTFPGLLLFGGILQPILLICLFLCSATYPFSATAPAGR